MLVDDNPTDRFIHRKLLEIYNVGVEILDFSGAQAALDYLRDHKEQPEKLPEVILLDVLMPELNGFDFLIYYEGFMDELAKVPQIFMLSSTDDEDDLRKARNNKNVRRMLRKPFSPEALMDDLSEL